MSLHIVTKRLLGAACVCWLLACGGDTEDPAAKFEPDPPGAWYAGDLHVHSTGASNDTGGDSFPADIAQRARERGLSFVVLTDHSNATGSDTTTTDEDPALFNQGPEFPHWDEVAALSEPGAFLMVDGNEISPIAAGDVPNEPAGHIGCIPEDLDTFDRSGAFTDRPRGMVTGGDALTQAKARGCFAVINHPYALTWMAYDWTNDAYDAMEVFNGGFGYDGFDEGGHAAWRCDLLQGRHVVPIGSSDNHRVNKPAPGLANHPALGFPHTAVFASELSWPAIMQGLREGSVAIGVGQSRVLLDGYDAEFRHAEGAAVRVLRLRGSLDPSASEAPVRLVHTTGCTDTRPSYSDYPIMEERVLLEQTVAPGESFHLETNIESAAGVYTAILDVPGGYYTALSRAIVIE